MARPTKYSEERAAAICKLLGDGCTRKAAYESNGISHGTFAEWLEKYPAFPESVTRAEAEAEAIFTKSIYKAATAYDADWRAAEFWLKRRRRDEWGDSVNVDLDKRISDLLETLAGGGQAETAG